MDLFGTTTTTRETGTRRCRWQTSVPCLVCCVLSKKNGTTYRPIIAQRQSAIYNPLGTRHARDRRVLFTRLLPRAESPDGFPTPTVVLIPFDRAVPKRCWFSLAARGLRWRSNGSRLNKVTRLTQRTQSTQTQWQHHQTLLMLQEKRPQRRPQESDEIGHPMTRIVLRRPNRISSYLLRGEPIYKYIYIYIVVIDASWLVLCTWAFVRSCYRGFSFFFFFFLSISNLSIDW